MSVLYSQENAIDINFLGPKSLHFQGPPLSMALEMDLPESKSLHPAPYKQQVHCYILVKKALICKLALKICLDSTRYQLPIFPRPWVGCDCWYFFNKETNSTHLYVSITLKVYTFGNIRLQPTVQQSFGISWYCCCRMCLKLWCTHVFSFSHSISLQLVRFLMYILGSKK
jgi:hypothetical protein